MNHPDNEPIEIIHDLMRRVVDEDVLSDDALDWLNDRRHRLTPDQRRRLDGWMEDARVRRAIHAGEPVVWHDVARDGSGGVQWKKPTHIEPGQVIEFIRDDAPPCYFIVPPRQNDWDFILPPGRYRLRVLENDRRTEVAPGWVVAFTLPLPDEDEG